MLKPILASLLAFAAFAADEAPKASTVAIDKAIDAQLAPASKAYDAYQKALSDATSKVVASLEKMKADYNDTKKFAGMSIADRAAAIAEVDGRIGDIKKGALGERVVASRSGDLLGGVDVAKMIVGKWFLSTNGDDYVFNKDGTCQRGGFSGKWIFENDLLTATWSNGAINVLTIISKDKLNLLNSSTNEIVATLSHNKK